jgi:hypothetical protein
VSIEPGVLHGRERARAYVVAEAEARLTERLGKNVNAASLFALVESQLGASVMLYLRK